MKLKRVKKTCCMDETGGKLPFHLCCPDCRKEWSAAERARLLEAGTAPDACSPEIPIAPARGPIVKFRELYHLPKGDDYVLVEAPYRTGYPGRTRDIFDIMTDQATRRGGAAPFTTAQVGVARDYRALHERVQSAGVKCSKAFDIEAGGQGRVDFMDAYMQDTERLAMFTRAIGTGVAMSVRKHGAHIMDRGSRYSISDATLIDMVCIGQQPLNAVLRVHGWSLAGKNRKRLQAALCTILGHMQGI